MGSRAILVLKEKGESNYFFAYHGANALSPLLRLYQAKELQSAMPEHPNIAHLFEHMDYTGAYQQERLEDAEMFFKCISADDIAGYMKDYDKHSLLEMRFILDLDDNFIQMEYNPTCPWYRTMGVFSIDLDVGLENVENLLAHAEKSGITDFGRIISIYHNSTGLAEKLDEARDYMAMEEQLNSPQVQEDRERYWRLFGHQEDLDAEDGEEMEER